MAAFRWWFGLTDYEARWLTLLYERGDAWSGTCALASHFGVSKTQVRVQISRLRAALEAEAIDTDPGRGYRLTDLGRGECRGALWSLAEELRHV